MQPTVRGCGLCKNISNKSGYDQWVNYIANAMKLMELHETCHRIPRRSTLRHGAPWCAIKRAMEFRGTLWAPYGTRWDIIHGLHVTYGNALFWVTHTRDLQRNLHGFRGKLHERHGKSWNTRGYSRNSTVNATSAHGKNHRFSPPKELQEVFCHFMEFHGTPFRSLTTCGFQWSFMALQGTPRSTIEFHGDPWMFVKRSEERHGFSVDLHGPPWHSTENSVAVTM